MQSNRLRRPTWTSPIRVMRAAVATNRSRSRAQQDRSTEFPVSMEAAVGERLRVSLTDPKLSARPHGYDVLAPGGRAGSLSLASVVGQSSRVWSARKVLGV